MYHRYITENMVRGRFGATCGFGVHWGLWDTSSLQKDYSVVKASGAHQGLGQNSVHISSSALTLQGHTMVGEPHWCLLTEASSSLCCSAGRDLPSDSEV